MLEEDQQTEPIDRDLNGHGKKPDTVGSPTENGLRAAIAMLERKRATASKRKQQKKV